MILEVMGSREDEGKNSDTASIAPVAAVPAIANGASDSAVAAKMRLQESEALAAQTQEKPQVNGVVETNGAMSPPESDDAETKASPAVAKRPAAEAVVGPAPRVTSQFYVVFHAISAGLNGAALGSDEADIVNLIFIVLDSEQNKVRKLSFQVSEKEAVPDLTFEGEGEKTF